MIAKACTDGRIVSRPRLRVALLATSVHFGGIERVLLMLLEHMDPEIELVPVVFTRTDTVERSFFERLRQLRVAHEVLYVDIARPVYIASPIRNYREALAILRRQRFDVIHTHGYRADVFAIALAPFVRVPLVSTCHGFISNDRRLRFYKALNLFVLRFFSRIVAVSAEMKSDLAAAGIEPAKVDVVINAVAEVPEAERETRRSRARERMGFDNEFVFGYVGRISEEKGIRYFIAAAAHLGRQSGNYRFVVVGDGPTRAGLEQATREGGLGDRVQFAGFQSDTSEWYSAMDAFVLPSLTEGTPMALLEAMAHRLPVIATSVGGVPAVIRSGENGLLVPAANVEALTGAMSDLAEDPVLRDRLAAAAVETIKSKFNVPVWIRQIRNIYMRAIVRGRRK